MSHEPPEMLSVAPGTYYSQEQARRATSLALALELCKGRNVQIVTVWAIARWLYNGECDE